MAYSILLVDDDRHLQRTLTDFLTFEGFSVVQAYDGEEALRKVDVVHPDVIVLDISMPGMSGLGFLKEISSGGDGPRYPVIVLTARSVMEHFFDDLDIEAFLAKPCSEAQLVEEIRRVIRKRQVREEPTGPQRRTILVAENDEDFADRLASELVREDFRVEVVRTGDQVLDRATEVKPSVIVMKEILPRMNGSVVASLLAVMASTRDIPIVLFDDTRTLGDEHRHHHTAASKVSRFLVSPGIAALREAVSEVLADQSVAHPHRRTGSALWPGL